MSTLRLVGVAPQPPLDPLTWSGISRYLFQALGRRGVLAGAVPAWPPQPLEWLAKGVAISPSRERWRERYELGRTLRTELSAVGGIRAGRVDREPDALLQIGGWYDFARIPRLRPRLRCSYHDCNLALSLREAGPRTGPLPRHVRRTVDAEQRLFDRLDVIMTMSEWLRRSFIEDYRQDPARVVNVGAGANLAAVPDLPERAWDPPRFLFVGIEWERKGGPEVLDAFERLRGVIPDAELWIVGPSAPPADGRRPGVRWVGRILRRTPAGESAIERLYREATCFVMPSRFEPFGVALLEAMAYGLPCVGSRRCAMPEIIEDGVSGSLVPASDADALGDALLAIASDPARAQAMGAAGRERLIARYTWDGVAGRMVTAIERRLDER
jgi:glycosyltransferase involved in cell wall biosynthesis